MCSFVKFSCVYQSFTLMCYVLGGFMKKADGYNISKKDFIQLSKCSENIYNTAVVIDCFVANQPEIEECYNLAPVIKHLRNDADVLNAFFIDHEKDIEI